MLNELITYAETLTDAPEPGFKSKEVRWALEFTSDGQFVNIIEFGNPDDKKNRGKLFQKCPDFSQSEIVSWGYRHFLVDSTEVVCCYTKETDEAKLKKLFAKHKTFTYLLKLASTIVGTLDSISLALADEDVLKKIRGILEEKKAKPTDSMTIRVDGQTLLELSTWHDWWRSFREEQSLNNKNTKTDTIAKTNRISFLSGKLVSPLPTHPKISGLTDVGGLSSGTTLIGFDKDSFCSYGFNQGDNATVGESDAAQYRASLDELIKNHSTTFVNIKIVHWYKNNVLENSGDPLDILTQGDDENNVLRAQQQIQKFLSSIETGIKVSLGDNQYYCLTLSATGGRIMIRDWTQGKITTLAENILLWFDDFAIVCRDGGNTLASSPKFYAVLGSLARDIKDIPPPLVVQIWRSAITGGKLPRPALAMALERIKSALYKDEAILSAGIGLVKAYLLRFYRETEGGNEMAENMKKFLNPDHPSPAYQCGRLMAYFASLQYRALGNVGAGIVQRYYASASTTPALVIGRLSTLAQFHLNKLKNKGAYWYEQQISEVFAKIGDNIPSILSLEEQSLFALGYYQQMAEIRTKKEAQLDDINNSIDTTKGTTIN